MIEGERIIISGASGFLGSHLSRELAKKNDVYTLGRNRPKDLRCHFIEADFKNGFDTSGLPSSIDRVIHLAGIVGSSGETQKEVFNINTVSTLSLLEYAKSAKARQFCFVSTGNTCGYYDGQLQEDFKINLEGLDFYSFSKAVAESMVLQYSANFQTLIIRPFYPYGPGQPKEKIIPRFIEQIKKGDPITTFNDGKNPRLSFIHINDFTEAFLKALELKESEILNITGDESFSIKEIAELLGSFMDKKPNLVDKKDASVKNRVGSTQKLTKLLNLKPKTKFRDGVKELLQ